MAIELLTRDEAAAFLQVSKSWLVARAREGLPPAFSKMGRQVRYIKSDLEEFVKASRTEHSAVETSKPPPEKKAKETKPAASKAKTPKGQKRKAAKSEPTQEVLEKMVQAWREGKIKL